MNNLNPNILFDLSKTFKEQNKHINKKLLPAIKSAMNPLLKVLDTEIIGIVRQLHKSRREVWKKESSGQIDKHKKRQHIASRREQVFFYKFIVLK